MSFDRIDTRTQHFQHLQDLGLMSAQEREDAIAELDIADHELLHPPEEDAGMPLLAPDANLVSTLAWLLLSDMLPKDTFLKRVADLPRQYQGAALQERQQLAAQGVQHYNRREIDELHEVGLLNDFQRDAAHAAVPGDRLLISPWIAMRSLVVNHVLSTQQFEELEVRTRAHGSELAREIMQAARLRHGHDRIPYKRPPAWKGALIVLAMLLVFSLIYGAATGKLGAP